MLGLHQDEIDRRFMQEAIELARKALKSDDVPVGALVVHEGRIIGRGCNQREHMQDPTAHAEMIALTAAAEYIGHWRCEDCTMYVTLEPCAMCAGAAMLSRIDTIVYGADDPKFGGCGSIFNIPQEPKTNHQIEIISGILKQEVVDLMKLFFKQVRQKKEQIN